MHTCMIKWGEVHLLTSHAALLLQPASIGAVCSRSLHFHCSFPSLFSTHLHLRSARRGPLSPVAALSTTSLSSWLPFTSSYVLWKLSVILSFICFPLCPCLMLVIYEAGAVSLKGISLCTGSLSGEVRWASIFAITVEECLTLEEHLCCRLHPLEQRQDGLWRKTENPTCTPGCALCCEESRLQKGRQKAATEGGEHLARGTRVTGVWGRWAWVLRGVF